MNRRLGLPSAALATAFLFVAAVALSPAGQSNQEALQMAVDLLRDTDPEMRALGLQQVREMPSDALATKRFASLLPELAPEVQVELLDALASRADPVGRPAVLQMCESPQKPVQQAALRALGALGAPDDVPLLVSALGDAEPKRSIAEASLTRLFGEGITAAIVDALQKAAPEIRVTLLGVLAARRAADSVPAVLEEVQDGDPTVRTAAMTVLGKLAGPEHVAGMLRAVLKTAPGAEREASEKAVMFVCQRIPDAEKRADPLLDTWTQFGAAEQTALLPLLGRIGGSAARKIVTEAIADTDRSRQDAGVRALCNWPDASVAQQLQELAQSGNSPANCVAALRALIRVAVLPDGRSDAQRLELLKAAMTMATRDEERKLVVARAKAVRAIESLRLVVPYLDEPALAQEACATVVELAHHRQLREPNKTEFDKALDAVLRVAKDPKLIDRAKRYKMGQT